MKGCPGKKQLYLFTAYFPNKIFMRQENPEGNTLISPHKITVAKKNEIKLVES